MADQVKRLRRYDASRRQAQARESRLAVLRAARDLFIDRGYGRTTMADVAAAAGVSVETVYAAYRNKPTLLHRVWDITIGGDNDEILFHDRPEVRIVRDEPDLSRRLMLHARVSTAAARRMTPFLLAMQGAAAAEPAAADLLAEIDRQRLVGIGVMAREAAATGQLAVSEEECRDVLWSCTDGMLWHRLVQERGWSDDRYAEWLGQMWVRTLVTPSGRGRAARRH